jgi:hypothetical protein
VLREFHGKGAINSHPRNLWSDTMMSKLDDHQVGVDGSTPDQILPRDSRLLGVDAGVAWCETLSEAMASVASLARQARRGLTVLTPDLEPMLYGQPVFLDAVRQLAIDRAGHVAVRILVIDASAAVQRNLQLVEIARRLPSCVQIAIVPEELAAECDAFLLADDAGYCLRRRIAPTRSQVDFCGPGVVRALRRRFDELWSRATTSSELYRLHL